MKPSRIATAVVGVAGVGIVASAVGNAQALQCEEPGASCAPLAPESPHVPDRDPSGGSRAPQWALNTGTGTGTGTNTGTVPPFNNNSMAMHQVDAARFQPDSMVYGTPPVLLRSVWD